MEALIECIWKGQGKNMDHIPNLAMCLSDNSITGYISHTYKKTLARQSEGLSNPSRFILVQLQIIIKYLKIINP